MTALRLHAAASHQRFPRITHKFYDTHFFTTRYFRLRDMYMPLSFLLSLFLIAFECLTDIALLKVRCIAVRVRTNLCASQARLSLVASARFTVQLEW